MLYIKRSRLFVLPCFLVNNKNTSVNSILYYKGEKCVILAEVQFEARGLQCTEDNIASLPNGIDWENVWQFDSKEPTLGYIMIMLLFDSVLYFMVGLYVEAVFPGDYGVPKKWYFPLSYTYWFGKSYNKDECSFEENVDDNEQFENEPVHLQIGVKIKCLSKQFGGKIVVENLSLNMYKDQISVVLGHNGAGKTTTMSMLIGMFPPTQGTAIVGGCDIRSNIKGVRKSLGLCPQHNVLFDELTVSETLYFYSRLKGLDEYKVQGEIDKYVKALDLESKANAEISTLSGGMKRKVSVAVAFCGNSEVVMLDEPTAGMDPSARRLLWDLLQTEKNGRTIVLTTHFMDEADFLGDRIAIMSNGKLQCCGSSFFLKKKYGAGYHLIIDISQQCNVDNITKLLKKYISSIKVSSSVGSELVYLLNEDLAHTFEEMLHDLETSAESLGINSYGISLTTLEEVFMKVGADKTDTEEEYSNEVYNVQNSKSSDIVYTSQETLSKKEALLSGWKLCANQIQAIFIKRFLSTVRSWILLVLQIVIPIVFVIFIIIIMLQAGTPKSLPKLGIHLDFYSDPVTLLSTNKNNSYTSSYRELFSSNSTVIEWENEDLNKNILAYTSRIPIEVRYQYIAAATMHENQTITAWFNNIPLHSAPLSLQLVLNAILHKEVSPEFNIRFHNHPLGYSFLNTELVSLLEGHSEGTTLTLNIAFSMAFVSSFYVIFYVKERAIKAKHLQFVSGMNIIPFWLPAFAIDFVTFAITSSCLIFTMAPFQIDGFSTVEELGRMLSLLLAFGVAMLPVMYLSSFLFKNSATAYTRMTFFNIFNGVGAYLVIGILKSPAMNLSNLAEVLDWIFIVFPHYALTDGINGLTMVNAVSSICEAVINKCIDVKITNYIQLTHLQCKFIVCYVERKCCKASKNFYAVEPPGILRNILILISIGILSFAILLCIEFGVFRKIRKILPRFTHTVKHHEPNIQEDKDVMIERERVQNLSQQNLDGISLVMKGVSKYYGNTVVVNDISLMVDHYECFGLLGVNGAGKTTTFKMMTGDIKTTSGNAWIYGLSLNIDMKSIQRLIGYCPQFDALLDELTPRETLVIFGLIRGIPRHKIKVIAEGLATDFDFYKHLDKKVRELSGGNKRKLSTSLALIGDPSILYLDEPTTGMDPVTKRYLWNCICKVRDSGKCIVITSHSMEECEALCTRLAIMVNGRLMCLGSTQHLKNKFSNTYTLTIKVKRSEVEEVGTKPVEHFVKENFTNASLREKHKELLVFSINDDHQQLSAMFGIMERAKLFLNIDDYSLGQCSLEQIFLRLTKYQIDD